MEKLNSFKTEEREKKERNHQKQPSNDSEILNVSSHQNIIAPPP